MQKKRAEVSHLIFPLMVVLAIGMVGCSFFNKEAEETSTQSTAKVGAVPVVKIETSDKALVSIVKDPVVEKWARVLAQADAIFREAWRLATKESLNSGKSPFGVIYRAIVKDLGVKLSSQGGLSCDRFRIDKNPGSAAKSWDIYYDCGQSAQAWVGQVFAQSENIRVIFSMEAHREVLGFQSSILFAKAECVLVVKGESIQSLSCDKMAKDKSATEVLKFERFEYSRNQEPMLYLKGRQLQNLSDQRKFEFRLPQTGKGLYVETELFAPEEEMKDFSKSDAQPTKGVVDTSGAKTQPIEIGAKDARGGRGLRDAGVREQTLPQSNSDGPDEIRQDEEQNAGQEIEQNKEQNPEQQNEGEQNENEDGEKQNQSGSSQGSEAGVPIANPEDPRNQR